MERRKEGVKEREERGGEKEEWEREREGKGESRSEGEEGNERGGGEEEVIGRTDWTDNTLIREV